MTIIGALPFQLQNGTTADATQVMSDFNKILNDTNTNAAHNGVNTDITALPGLVTPITPVQGGTNVWYASSSGGTANAQTVATPTPSGFTLSVGNRIVFLASASNTGAMTLNVNSTGVTAVLKPSPAGPIALTGGEVIANNYVECIYDGTQFQLYTNVDQTGGVDSLTNLASATTTDLGTIASHNINITGVTTITGFGSTAVATYPLYQLTFAGILILTYNATSLILPGSTNITTAAGDTAQALYLGSGNWQIISYTRRNGQALNFPANFLQNYLTGLTLSYSSTTVFGIAAGEAADSTNVSLMLLASAYTKTTSSWAVGSGNGGLDTGAIGAASWYHVYLIQRPDTGVVDVLFSLSASSPTLPANYTLFRRIGSLKTSSSQWVSFTQYADKFIWAAYVADVNGTPSASRVLTTLSVPTGVVVSALFRAELTIAGSATLGMQLVAIIENDVATTAVNGNLYVTSPTGNTCIVAGNYEILTDTSARIGVRGSAAAGTVTVNTYGWIDTRGRLG